MTDLHYQKNPSPRRSREQSGHPRRDLLRDPTKSNHQFRVIETANPEKYRTLYPKIALSDIRSIYLASPCHISNSAKTNFCNHYLYLCQLCPLQFPRFCHYGSRKTRMGPAVPFSFLADGRNPAINLQRLPKVFSQVMGLCMRKKTDPGKRPQTDSKEKVSRIRATLVVKAWCSFSRWSLEEDMPGQVRFCKFPVRRSV